MFNTDAEIVAEALRRVERRAIFRDNIPLRCAMTCVANEIDRIKGRTEPPVGDTFRYINHAVLIADLKNATEGSRKLSDRMLLACGWFWCPTGDHEKPFDKWTAPNGDHYSPTEAHPSPTENLGDAVALLSKERWWTLRHHLNPTLPNRASAVELQGLFDVNQAATPALAVCIAKLKALTAASTT